MIFYVRGRQGGKTTEMIRFLRLNPGAVCLVHSGDEVQRLEREYPDLKGCFINTTTNTDMRGIRGPVVIDNLDLILQKLLGLPGPLALVTATGVSM